MRNPNRIYKYCNELAECWSKVPDWRFGQLFMNFLSYYVNQTKAVDPFYVEDEVLFQHMKNYFNSLSPVEEEEVIENA